MFCVRFFYFFIYVLTMDVIHENVFLGEMLLTHICTQILKIKI